MSNTSRSRTVRLFMVLAVVASPACSEKPKREAAPRSAAQQRAVDSTIGASRLPGAGGVQGALRASDSAAARARQLDSLARTP